MKGEVAFTADGQSFTLAFSINALIRLEEATGRGINDLGGLLADPASLRLGTLRTVFRCGLTDHHPEIDDDAAGRIMTAVGMAPASEMIGKALNAAFGEGVAANGADKGPFSKSTRPGSKSASTPRSTGA